MVVLFAFSATGRLRWRGTCCLGWGHDPKGSTCMGGSCAVGRVHGCVAGMLLQEDAARSAVSCLLCMYTGTVPCICTYGGLGRAPAMWFHGRRTGSLKICTHSWRVARRDRILTPARCDARPQGTHDLLTRSQQPSHAVAVASPFVLERPPLPPIRSVSACLPARKAAARPSVSVAKN